VLDRPPEGSILWDLGVHIHTPPMFQLAEIIGKSLRHPLCSIWEMDLIHHYPKQKREGSIMKTIKGMPFVKLLLPVLLLLFISTAYAAEQTQMDSSPAGSQKAKMAPTAKMSQTPMTVNGTIVANKNKAGKIISFALKEDNGQDIMLSKHGKGMELRKMVGKKVEAVGTVQESKGKKWITVKEFKALP
jgi:hypothetical protein